MPIPTTPQACLRDKQGAVAVEFGLIVAILIPAAFGAGSVLGPPLHEWTDTLRADIERAEELVVILGIEEAE